MQAMPRRRARGAGPPIPCARGMAGMARRGGSAGAAAGIPACFCAPRHPWEKGTNESAHGLLRDFFPTGRSLDGATDAEVNAAYAMLNRRPRKHLGWK